MNGWYVSLFHCASNSFLIYNCKKFIWNARGLSQQIKKNRFIFWQKIVKQGMIHHHEVWFITYYFELIAIWIFNSEQHNSILKTNEYKKLIVLELYIHKPQQNHFNNKRAACDGQSHWSYQIKYVKKRSTCGWLK